MELDPNKLINDLEPFGRAEEPFGRADADSPHCGTSVGETGGPECSADLDPGRSGADDHRIESRVVESPAAETSIPEQRLVETPMVDKRVIETPKVETQKVEHVAEVATRQPPTVTHPPVKETVATAKVVDQPARAATTMTRKPETAIPKRPTREVEYQETREKRFRWGTLAVLGLLALGAIGLASLRGGDAPEKLAFADDATEVVGHDGHDHSNLVQVPNSGDDYEVLGLGGDVPTIIGENFAMPRGSEVIHVVTHGGDIWEFEGTLPDGASFWKVIDLNKGLLYDAGNEANAIEFP